MRVDVVSETSRVTAIEHLEPFLEYGTLAVRLDAVTRVLDALREAASALTPVDAPTREANPARMQLLAQVILQASESTKNLAEAALAVDPNNPDALAVMGILRQLHMAPDSVAADVAPVPAEPSP